MLIDLIKYLVVMSRALLFQVAHRPTHLFIFVMVLMVINVIVRFERNLKGPRRALYAVSAVGIVKHRTNMTAIKLR